MPDRNKLLVDFEWLPPYAARDCLNSVSACNALPLNSYQLQVIRYAQQIYRVIHAHLLKYL
jgi:hypothetical protein